MIILSSISCKHSRGRFTLAFVFLFEFIFGKCLCLINETVLRARKNSAKSKAIIIV